MGRVQNQNVLLCNGFESLSSFVKKIRRFQVFRSTVVPPYRCKVYSKEVVQ